MATIVELEVATAVGTDREIDTAQETINTQLETMQNETSVSKCDKCEQQCGPIIFIARIFRTIISFFLSYTILWSIISEILLLIEVYSVNDHKFFMLSCSFLIIPLLFVSFMICVGEYRQEWLEHNACKYLSLIPIINIPMIMSHSTVSETYDNELTILDALLIGTMTFPLYIINLSYLCETITKYNDIDIFNIIQLTLSIISFIKAPSIFIWNRAKNVDGDLSLCDGLKIIFASLFAFGPIVLIEVLHFFPLIFAYYVDYTLVYIDLIIILTIFNIPKLIFIIHINRKVCEDGEAILSRLLHIIQNTLILVTLPLIPYLLIIFAKESQEKHEYLFRCCGKSKEKDNGWYGSATKYYWNVVIYLFISYGASCIYIIAVCGYQNLSIPVQISILTIIILMIVITFTFPFAYTLMKQSGVDMTGVCFKKHAEDKI